VLVLEVKGCHRLRRKDGLWYYGADAAGDPRGPFKQASEAMYSLRERVTKHRPHLRGVLFRSAVCFPFIELTDESEEWHSWQVLDKVRLGPRCIADCVASALRQARERAAGLRKTWFDPSAGEPTKEQCDEIVRVLRPDFEYFESPQGPWQAHRCGDPPLHRAAVRRAGRDAAHAARRLRRHPRLCRQSGSRFRDATFAVVRPRATAARECHPSVRPTSTTRRSREPRKAAASPLRSKA
jgi:hypothetical protein